jgi:RND family efflux transporter MFP subunit
VKFLKAVVPAILVLIAALVVVKMLQATKPGAKKIDRPVRPPSVQVITVTPTDYQVTIPTRGEVRARTRSVLIPEVPGRIVSVAANFRDGGFFEKGDILVEIDQRDYVTAATVAAGNVAEARNAHEQEKARAAQAKDNWERLGKGKEPNDLVLRVPQLVEAKALVDAAVAQLDQAQNNLERTKIRAPYAGRILEQLVDIGQFVTTGTSMARIFAVDYAEARLPLSNRQVGFIDLPEDFRGETGGETRSPLPEVVLSKQQGTQTLEWPAKIVRTEGAIDTRSRQLFVVAQVDDPYRKSADGTPPLKIGDFVEASISGRVLEGVFVIPRTAVREGDQVLVVDADQRLRIRDINVIWGDRDQVVVDEGLVTGETICTKPPAYATEGAQVVPLAAKPSAEK